MTSVVPFLWYAKEAEEAARFYCSVIPNSHVDAVGALAADSPSGPAGSVAVVEFTLAGTKFEAMSASPLDPFNHAISLLVNCEDQAEIDRVWAGLLEGGGQEQQCGWLKDRYGVYWQIVPKGYEAMMRDPDRARAKRVAEAMLKMVKFDIAALERAYRGG
ncbi:MAG TPA: VOC family protein [Rhizomicrobium sp.]|nr:VOC family protein [Rhizomicrobium sp.]